MARSEEPGSSRHHADRDAEVQILFCAVPCGTEKLAKILEIVSFGLKLHSPEGFRTYMVSPLPHFRGSTPLELVQAGEEERVLSVLVADHQGQGYF